MSEVEFQIPSPPQEVYQEQKQLIEGKDPLLNEKSILNWIEKMEWVQWQGAVVYFVGAKYPKRYFPTPDAVHATNQVKRLLKFSLVSILLSNNKNIALHEFNNIANRCLIRFHNDNGIAKLETHKRKLEMVCPTTLYVAEFVCQTLISLGVEQGVAVEFGIVLGHIFEYDDAWRAMFQDIMTELDVEKFKKNSNKEFRRLMKTFMKRETLKHVKDKAKIILIPISLVLYIPKYRNAVKEQIHLLKNCQLDEWDKYWVWRRPEYDFYGIPWEERKKTVDMLEGIQVTL